jgi:glycosyltransferase involved in cell wall biosynthesis
MNTLIGWQRWVRRDEPLFDRMKRGIRYVQRSVDGSYLPDNWFSVSPAVKLLWKPNLNARFIPDADIVVATGAPTAEWVNSYPPEKGKKFYLLQHYETWDSIGRNRLDATYLMPLEKIAISRWLCDVARERGSRATYVPNGLDQNRFYVTADLNRRDRSHGIMLYHPLPEKGTQIGIQACDIARKEIPDLKMTMFGVYERPASLPAWINYCKRPSWSQLLDMYNAASFVVAPSVTEGWGLVPCEAMQCGCALVATNAGGHLEFARHNETALVSPVSDAIALARNIALVSRDDELRKRIAASGTRYLRKFSWDQSTHALNEIFLRAQKNV